MAKSSKKKTSKVQTKKTEKAPFSVDAIIPPKYQTAAAIGIIVLLVILFFSPMYFGNKTFHTGDIISTIAPKTYLEQDKDSFSLWFPYQFGGMPAYGVSINFPWFNFLPGIFTLARGVITSISSVDYAQWTFYLMMLGVTMYFLIYYFTKNRLISLFGGLTSLFSTGIIVFFFIGHVTKLNSLCMLPLLFLMILKLHEKITLGKFFFLVVVVLMSLQGFHVQIIFYNLLAIGIYFLIRLISTYYKKAKEEFRQYWKVIGVFSASFLIAILLQSTNLTQVYEYTQYSTRGTESILDKEGGKNTKQSESDFYQYATNWSFSPGEVLTFVVPSYYGWGKSEYKGELMNNQETEINTYFGQMPFVDVAMYMGVIVFFLGIFSMYANRKNHFVLFLTILSIFALFVSFGRTFPIIYDMMFNFFPFFDKFRIPSMILVLVQISFPILAALGIYRVVNLKKEPNEGISNLLKYFTFGFAGIFVATLLLNQPIGNWFAERVGDHINTLGTNSRSAQYLNYFKSYMVDMFTQDVYIAFGLLTFAFGAMYLYTKEKLGAHAMILLVLIAAVFDLWRIDSRGAIYTEQANIEQMFEAPGYVKVIQNQKDEDPFRILSLKQDGSPGSFGQNSNYHSYFLLEDMHGYSAIKPRSYQDILDVVGTPVNQTLWRMMNVKYIIFDQEVNIPGLQLVEKTNKSAVYETVNVLPRFFFVDTVEKLDNYDMLLKLKAQSFDPAKVAYVHEEATEVDKPDSTAYVNVNEYHDEYIELDVKASGNHLLYVGNTYAPVGWKAYIDGEKTDIVKVNHGFIGIKVPEGKHVVSLRYLPDSFVITEYLSLTLSIIVTLGLFFALYREFFKRKETTSKATA